MSQLSNAQEAAIRCSGENAPDLANLCTSNVITTRNDFLHNVSHNGGCTHRDIITVLEFMTFWVNIRMKEINS